mgnify:CR=1 FL=1|tara:strand:- start:241 stop:501 length:261 start_codon:yes stop_codon:yes gene_type:complete
MDIENLIKNIKIKLLKNSLIQHIKIEDKTYLHIKHSSHDKNKFHLKVTIYSNDLKRMSKLEATKIINKILANEIKYYIHSIQILFE